MESSKEFKLINGTFKPADAGALIRNFYSEKIRYHNRQLLYMIETQQGDRSQVEAKIAELESTRQDISIFLETKAQEDSFVEVKGSISITFNR
ncbi:hypothetical protein MUY27_07670 [Mucilaginibacter sp. RS28]|uniref:Uncharacterized protein n=1 Tax=Mucilaginibacter straminoryzae TaxID=2932774 RepID=A0A9X2BCS0_9SPHI|nr:hypothetical protein [Mucilaginibacter straminoryzae]MCJ8209583.1 hypothetical protein [Mucilaginibacter straminoryzae]